MRDDYIDFLNRMREAFGEPESEPYLLDLEHQRAGGATLAATVPAEATHALVFTNGNAPVYFDRDRRVI